MRWLGSQRAVGPRSWILASASPRRSDLLRAAGQRFECMASRVDETPRSGEQALDSTQRIARDKAREVFAQRPGRWVLAADTIVIVDGQALGKPEDAAEASRMLGRLSGRRHEVATAFVLLDERGEVFVERVVKTEVVFRSLDSAEIAAYVAGGEPFDKAGAYAVQCGGATFVVELRGSRSNVIGLPMDEVERALRAAGLWISQG
jgi:septum formation protein